MKSKGDSFDVFQSGRRFCWLSGWTPSFNPPGWHGPRNLQVAHIASGSGKAVRVNDRRAVILLHGLCHDLHVSSTERLCSKVICDISYPTIDESHALYLKMFFDPEYYDESFLQSIWIGRIPKPSKPPVRWINEMMLRQGILL